MSTSARWSDLVPRIVSGLAMAGLGAVIVWIGGWLLAVATGVLCGLMIWETARMFGAQHAIRSAGVAGLATLAAAYAPWYMLLPVLIAAALVCSQNVNRNKVLVFGLAGWIMLGGLTAILFRETYGAIWLLWLVCVVVASDIAGYFAGRTIGGPKFWPSISPKKTWSGTVAGWVSAAVIGLVFASFTGAGLALVPVSVVVCFSGQLGDIAESAVKRQCEVKDSSDLIPGHGGVFDRFDAFLGASAMTCLLWISSLLPGIS